MPRSGGPGTVTDEQVAAMVKRTLESTPKNATHWSTRATAQETGLSQSTVSRIWRAFGLQPHRTETLKLSTDPYFVDKVHDMVGLDLDLDLDPPERALVFCFDEKSRIQALDRSPPVLPMMPGVPQRITHDYVRSGTTTLFAALEVATGKVIGSLHRRHRAEEFKKFLIKLDQEVPADLDVRLVPDSYATHVKCQCQCQCLSVTTPTSPTLENPLPAWREWHRSTGAQRHQALAGSGTRRDSSAARPIHDDGTGWCDLSIDCPGTGVPHAGRASAPTAEDESRAPGAPACSASASATSGAPSVPDRPQPAERARDGEGRPARFPFGTAGRRLGASRYSICHAVRSGPSRQAVVPGFSRRASTTARSRTADSFVTVPFLPMEVSRVR
ncbi:hypothetical protein M2169_005888 [Streptomyces sp. MJP52]|nr:hypothetical protein [Streptomyces sp. MJP52]